MCGVLGPFLGYVAQSSSHMSSYSAAAARAGKAGSGSKPEQLMPLLGVNEAHIYLGRGGAWAQREAAREPHSLLRDYRAQRVEDWAHYGRRQAEQKEPARRYAHGAPKRPSHRFGMVEGG